MAFLFRKLPDDNCQAKKTILIIKKIVLISVTQRYILCTGMSTILLEQTMNNKSQVYNAWQNHQQKVVAMDRNKNKLDKQPSIGARIAKLRQERGYSQRELAKETGISHRMIAYYEKQGPPSHVLPILAQELGASLDQLFGIKKIKPGSKKKDVRLWRRFAQIEKMDTKEKRKIIQLLDTFIENERLRQKAAS